MQVTNKFIDAYETAIGILVKNRFELSRVPGDTKIMSIGRSGYE